MMTTQKLYTEMTAEEQLQWVTELADVTGRLQSVIEAAAKRRVLPASIDTKAVQRLFGLLCAWPFAQDFCEKARRYGDYMARVSRLPVYIEKVQDALADGLTTTDAQGRRVAVVLPGVPARRRGRPTKEETAARLRGEVVLPTDDSPETRKRMAIAKMLGLEVVGGEPVREKNNAELAQEREAKKAEEEMRNPTLFKDTSPDRPTTDRPSPDPSLLGRGVDSSEPKDNSRPSIQGKATGRRDSGNGNGGGSSPCAQLQSDAYELRMAQDKLHLNQLAWMLSPELAKRTETVQSLRVTSESASERAKLLAEQGADAKTIEPYAQQAKEATEAYLAIYADVDEELAVLHKRLYLDEPFVERFKARFKGVNIERVQYITRPYYEKVKSPELDLRIKTIIEQENPEYAAKMKAEEEKKREVSELLRYLKRKDKPNVKQRIETMKKRYTRLVELLGEQEASVYRPIVDAAIDDYEAHYKKPDADAPGVVADGGEKATVPDASASSKSKKGAKKETRKATKQESNNENIKED